MSIEKIDDDSPGKESEIITAELEKSFQDWLKENPDLAKETREKGPVFGEAYYRYLGEIKKENVHQNETDPDYVCVYDRNGNSHNFRPLWEMTFRKPGSDEEAWKFYKKFAEKKGEIELFFNDFKKFQKQKEEILEKQKVKKEDK